MARNEYFSRLLLMTVTSAAFLFLSACSVNVKKEADGREKQVDIKTLVGGLHVSNQAESADVGLAVYPGARVRDRDTDGSNKTANVNLSGFGYRLRVIALEYVSDDAPSKVLAYYKTELKKYGSVLECRSSRHFQVTLDNHKSNSDDLTCEGNTGNNVELKVGKKDDQHIVAVEPEGKGSSFSLVYVRTHGKDADI